VLQADKRKTWGWANDYRIIVVGRTIPLRNNPNLTFAHIEKEFAEISPLKLLEYVLYKLQILFQSFYFKISCLSQVQLFGNFTDYF